MFFHMVYKSGQSFYRFVTIHACDGQTDRWTDRILLAIPRLHYMQRGEKNRRFRSNAFSMTKISGRRGRPHQSFLHGWLWPMNALQLCWWQFSHKETL